MSDPGDSKRRSWAFASALAAVWGFLGCSAVLGEYDVDESITSSSSSGSAPPQCTTSEQCDEGKKCTPDGFCRQPCLDKDDCYYYFSECHGYYCSEHVGIACNNEKDCGGLYCDKKDSRDNEVAGYCTISCSVLTDCPKDYECVHSRCRKIGTEGPLCYVPAEGTCSGCMLQNCGWDLQDCCGYAAPCQSVFDDVLNCDLERTHMACNKLYYPDGGGSASADLRNCVSDNCETKCWNPCPGQGC